jgi:hypothetical protein
MSLLNFLLALAQAFRNLPGQIVDWLAQTLHTAADALPAPLLAVTAVLGALLALAALRTRVSR